jgi:hypothetical protein
MIPGSYRSSVPANVNRQVSRNGIRGQQVATFYAGSTENFQSRPGAESFNAGANELCSIVRENRPDAFGLCRQPSSTSPEKPQCFRMFRAEDFQPARCDDAKVRLFHAPVVSRSRNERQECSLPTKSFRVPRYCMTSIRCATLNLNRDGDKSSAARYGIGMVQISIIISALGLLSPEEPFLAFSSMLALTWLSRR